MFDKIISFIRDYYHTEEPVPLHAPLFCGNEKNYVLDTIDSTFVSSVGAYVDRFENDLKKYTGSEGVVAVVNGTSALHISLLLAGVEPGDLVITQPLTFVATCNAIAYTGADPIFLDVNRSTLGLSPQAVESWLEENAYIDDDECCRHTKSKKKIRCCVPMHTFGHPVQMDLLINVCRKWNIRVVEDSTEALGSYYRDTHCGTFGESGVLSFNGNKILTTGGGGAILTDLKNSRVAKHLTTTAKIPHTYEFVHDTIGYNYRMPNLNAALGCAQMENLSVFLAAKRDLASQYRELFKNSNFEFVTEPENCRSNYWLNAIVTENKNERDRFLEILNQSNVMVRPIWKLMNSLPMYKKSLTGPLMEAAWLEERIVNIPSSVMIH